MRSSPTLAPISARAIGAAQLIRPSVETRQEVRKALTAAPQFAQIDPPTQQELAHSLVRIAEAARLLAEEADKVRPAAPPRAAAMNAGDEFSCTDSTRECIRGGSRRSTVYWERWRFS